MIGYARGGARADNELQHINDSRSRRWCSDVARLLAYLYGYNHACRLTTFTTRGRDDNDDDDADAAAGHHRINYSWRT